MSPTERVFECAEVLFKPHLIDLQSEGIHKMAYNSIFKCDVDIRETLWTNMLLAGMDIVISNVLNVVIYEAYPNM